MEHPLQQCRCAGSLSAHSKHGRMVEKMKKQILGFLIIVVFLLAGCRTAPAPADAAPSPTAERLAAAPAATAIAETQPPVEESDGGDACSPELQSRALRPEYQPDWDSFADATCYRLAIELQPEVPGYQGTANITFTNTTGQPLETIVLRTYPNAAVIYGGSLQVTRATLAGQTVQPEGFLPDQTGVRLPVPGGLPAGKTIAIELAFEGRLPQDLADAPNAYGVFNASSSPRSLALANWYPILAEQEAGDWQAQAVSGLGDAVVSPTALYDVQVSAPEGWQIAASGREIEPGRYVSGPMRDFMLLASPDYQVSEQDQDGLRLRLFSLPGDQARLQDVLQATARSVELFEERFGPYPYNELDIVSMPLNLALGVEYPGLFTLKDTMFAADSSQPWLLTLVAAHEAAHQWWYALVGNDVIEDPWQDEALATFSSLLYQERYEPSNYRGTRDAYQETVARALESAKNPDFTRGVPAFSDQPELYGPLVYQRGALFYLALQEVIGSRAFFEALQAYYQENLYQIAAPEALLSAFETSCGCELDDFYARWQVESQ